MESVYTWLNNEVESLSPVGCLNSSLGNGSGYAKNSSFINQKFRLQKAKVSVTENKSFRYRRFNIAEI